MMKLSRGAIAAIAIAAAVPAGVAIAKSFDHGGWHRMSPEARARLDEGRLAMAKTALKLNADQEKLWAALETEIRAASKARADKRAEFEKMREERQKDGAQAKKPDLIERLDRMSQNMSERADRMKAFVAAFKPLYATLTDEQKEVLRPLMRDLAPGGGRGHHGPRWADGGFGGHNGWGGHGWGRHGGERHGDHHGWGRHHERDGGGGGRGDEGPPPAPQNMPEGPQDDEGGTPSDNL